MFLLVHRSFSKHGSCCGRASHVCPCFARHHSFSPLTQADLTCLSEKTAPSVCALQSSSCANCNMRTCVTIFHCTKPTNSKVTNSDSRQCFIGNRYHLTLRILTPTILNDLRSFAASHSNAIHHSVHLEVIAAPCNGADHQCNRVGAIHACALYYSSTCLCLCQSNRLSAI